ncbi:hypothetical protein M0802_014389 [Mischocyttarus mexicanus]|nr:hypothetical protein M0802_014389 [Mischocyttarus mexicanus]
MVGHACANCNLKPVCPKCTGAHTVSSCTFNDNPDKSKFCCTNCDEQKKKQAREAAARRLTAIEKVIITGTSYANMASRANFRLPLDQSIKPMKQVRAGAPKPVNHIRNIINNSANNGSNGLEQLLVNFKNDILKEIHSINAKIIKNPIRIDQIMSHLYTDKKWTHATSVS